MTLRTKFSSNRDGPPGFEFRCFSLDLACLRGALSDTSHEAMVNQAMDCRAELASQIVSAEPMVQSREAQATRG
jgi:hypothetical protein